jgi:hypothetical protein
LLSGTITSVIGGVTKFFKGDSGLFCNVLLINKLRKVIIKRTLYAKNFLLQRLMVRTEHPMTL